MTRRQSNHPWRLVNLALFASAASARTISLSSFELISSIFIAPTCLDAYNTPLDGCELQDFLMGRECSQTCVANLLKIETTIQKACSAANPRPGTLLSRTKNGELVAALCGTAAGGGANGNVSPTMTTITTTTTQVSSGFPVSMTTVTKAITPKPAPIGTTTTTISSLPSVSTRESSSTVLKETSSSSIIPSRSSSSVSSQQPAATESSLVPPSIATSTRSGAATSAAPGGDNSRNRLPPGNGGGGLDTVGIEASGATRSPSRMMVLSALAGAIMMVAL